jgi:predicted HAD superfamily Cof-like phosphohydrolase
MTNYYKTLFELVREFHEAYEMPVGTVNIHDDFDKIEKEDAERIALRSNLVAEEFKELINAESCEEIMKESCDLIYVILGTFVEFGWDLEEAFRRVHLSNMSKLGEDGKPIYREDGKVLKGPNYKKPDLSDLV